jgi:hypothetical protein
MLTLTPAYGRDYKSKGEVIEALHEGVEFIINEVGHRYNNKPCQIKELPDGTIKVRWNSLRNVGRINPKDYK